MYVLKRWLSTIESMSIPTTYNAQHTKRTLCNLRTTKAQISLHIHAGWSGPPLSTYRMKGYCSICLQTENVQIRLHRCSSSPGHSLFAYGIRAFFPHCASSINHCPADWLIVLGFNDTSTLEGHFVSSPREREKRDRRESRGDERERQGRKRNRNESEETEEIKTFHLYPYPLQE